MSETSVPQLRGFYVNYAHLVDGQLRHPEVRQQEFDEAIAQHDAENAPVVQSTDEIRDEQFREIHRLGQRRDTLLMVETLSLRCQEGPIRRST